MHNSICENLLETGEAEEGYFLADDEDIEEPDSISLLNVILSGTARLNVLLPATTVLAFTIFSPLITKDGQCSSLSQWLMGLFLALLAASCIFFAFTDSFQTATGRLYYGVATFNGIWTFCGRKRPCVPTDYRLRWSDLFHSSLSLIAFLTFAASHSDVSSCYNLNLPRRATDSVPLVVGFVISALFILFPSRRKGIGYPFLLQSDAFCSRN